MISLAPYALARIAIGGAVLVAPTTAARTWIGPAAADPDVRAPLRMFGVRDALLGVAVLGAGRRPEALRGAVTLCIAADVTDAVVCLAQLARTRRPGAALAAAAAIAGTAMGTIALRRLPA